MVSKYILCLFLIPSYLFCASEEPIERDYEVLFASYNFVLSKDDSGVSFCIGAHCPKGIRIGIIEFSKDCEDCMHINLIKINKIHQGQGLGSILLQLAMKISEAQKCNCVKLTACPDSSTQKEYDTNLLRLEKWYQRFGFESHECPEGYDEIPMSASRPFQLDLVPSPKIT